MRNPTISRQQAIHIVRMRAAVLPDAIQISSEKPERLNAFSLYFNDPTEARWYAVIPWGDGKDGMMLRSSRVVVVSATSGQVLYDGSAGDEG